MVRTEVSKANVFLICIIRGSYFCQGYLRVVVQVVVQITCISCAFGSNTLGKTSGALLRVPLALDFEALESWIFYLVKAVIVEDWNEWVIVCDDGEML